MTTSTTPPDHAPVGRSGLAFATFAFVVIAANALLVRNAPRVLEGPAPEWPLMVDLLLFVPLAYLAINWRRGRAAVVTALGWMAVGVVAGSLILPDESKRAWLVVENLRYVALGVVLALQLAMITLLLTRVARERHARNLEVSLERAIAERFGHSFFARALQLESRVWLYALLRRPIRHAFPGDRHFHVHRQGMNASNQVAFLILLGFELPVAHVLVSLISPMAAIVVTALSAYGFVFMLAEYRATLHRPLSVTDQGLHVRYGVMSDFLLGWSSIRDVAPTRGPVRRARGRLRLVGMGEANLLITLAPGTRVPGLAGSRLVEQVYLGVDDPDGLTAAIRARRWGG